MSKLEHFATRFSFSCLGVFEARGVMQDVTSHSSLYCSVMETGGVPLPPVTSPSTKKKRANMFPMKL